MKKLPFVRVGLILGLVALAACSEDTECPTCPTRAEWVEYDNFDDNNLSGWLWSYIADCCGGQVLEADSVLQVWGHTADWTGTGIVRAIETRLAWKFDLVETYHEGGSGCQGWHIRAYDPDVYVSAEVLNQCTAGCWDPPNWGDVPGTYEIKHEADSLAVYRGGSLLRRVQDKGIDFFVMEFVADNMDSSGGRCHMFIDNVWGLEWRP